MREAVLRVSGPEFNPEKFLHQHRLSSTKVWRSGEPDSEGRVRADSGFNLRIADARTPAELVHLVRSWLEIHKAQVLAIRHSGASATLDLGVTVGSADAFTVSISLPPADLADLAEAGVELCVSAYPASD